MPNKKLRVHDMLARIQEQLHYSGCISDYDWGMYQYAFRSVLELLKSKFRGTSKCRISGWTKQELLSLIQPHGRNSLLNLYQTLVINLYYDSFVTPPVKTQLGPKNFYCCYCNATASFQKFDKLNRRQGNYGYICDGLCDASVSYHEGDKMPMGTLADEPLRKLRDRAKKAVDAFAIKSGLGLTDAYGLMAERMGLSMVDIPIARLDFEQCEAYLRSIESLKTLSKNKRFDYLKYLGISKGEE
ncbi:zinc-finger-containing protein [Idiomarina piscisalsi]|uniref:zinc-finger-containing protein n=1 Tax=Idiomarina piscisalsi TaxID=1096243 RepID=UPI0013817807|nr:zinc-finger-containing protein [Idiomarina piscisalsi]MTJ02669.1 hypothetical protein [Idiomarina piscisalsi]